MQKLSKVDRQTSTALPVSISLAASGGKSYVKAGFHLCESGSATARPALWACVVCFSEEDSLVTLDRATEFGSWIDFYFFATSNSNINQHA